MLVAIALLSAACSSGQQTLVSLPPTGPINCGNPAALSSYPTDPSWKGVRIGTLFFAGFDTSAGQAVITDFNPGHPTKMVIEPTEPLSAALRLEGFRCSDSQRLRFEYGSSWNKPVVALLPASLDSNGRPLAYTGYMLFTSPGKWLISVSRKNGHLIGSVVFLVEGHH